MPDVLLAFFAKVAPDAIAEPEAERLPMASPSGSDAETANVSNTPASPVVVAGAKTAGARLPSAITVVAEPESAFAAVNVTL